MGVNPLSSRWCGEGTTLYSTIVLSEPPYPNNLRALRGSVNLTRAELARRTVRTAAAQSEDRRSATVSALEKIEAGSNRPRLATARAIAAALNKTIEEIFPEGIHPVDFVPNPTGRSGR